MKKCTAAEKRKLTRIRRIWKTQKVEEIRLTPGHQTHEQLWQIAIKLPSDYEPYGQASRGGFSDCSCGCRWYHPLTGGAGSDWGICANAAGPRAGLLTFEHQGCPQFERDARFDYLDTAKGSKVKKQYEEREEELRNWRKEHPVT
jgi:hypothetical protein